MQTGGIPECATEQVIEVFEIRDEITPENWICMLEQADEGGGEFYGGYESTRKCKG